MTKYELIIFDLDGTLLNTLEDLQNSLNHALLLSHFPPRSRKEVKSFVGNGIGKLIERAVGEAATASQLKQLYQDFMNHYQVHCTDTTRPYDGVLQLLHTLRKRGYKTAVVSNKADAAVKELCHQYFSGLFDYAAGEREGLARKPEPDLVRLVLDRLDCTSQKALYIGDSEVDILTADKAGLDAVIVDWGFRDASFLKQHGAKSIVSSPDRILTLLN